MPQTTQAPAVACGGFLVGLGHEGNQCGLGEVPPACSLFPPERMLTSRDTPLGQETLQLLGRVLADGWNPSQVRRVQATPLPARVGDDTFPEAG